MQKMLSSAIASALATSLALAIPAHAAATAAPTVHEAPLRAHLQFLSSDVLEGRGTGQRGGDLAVAYLESQAMAAGLKPANGNSYRQSVKIAGVKATPQDSNVVLEAGGKRAGADLRQGLGLGAGRRQAGARDGRRDGVRRLWHHRAGARLGRLQGPRLQGQDPGDDGQRPDADRGRAGPFRRQGPDLLRPLDLQVRRSGAPWRRRRAADPHRRIGLVRLERGAEQLDGRALPAGRRQAGQRACKAG